MQIFVGNLAPEVTEEELQAAFEAFGQVKTVQIARDLFSGVSKGFGFVEMPGKAHSAAAIMGLNGKDLKGSPLKVNESRPKTFGRRR
ncbi:RNA recognition motif domain-containing protein [Sulfurirhabdus autotrophica]|uniref:RNA recognition motif-containing protein n=1 Tax=Sulfurirhabdus autotrophica TaxID=1706046 RepID=A0A4R3YF97_9PROT|nr:RNA-binding protein [Sulfurirhabdus autotrophica]TCV90867.1 RNA recognition motif-containing protein [Sulfurirhabdus autotrophica]